jgi:hypothetical protein
MFRLLGSGKNWAIPENLSKRSGVLVIVLKKGLDFTE